MNSRFENSRSLCSRFAAATFLLTLTWLASCANPEMLSPSDESTQRSPISPAEAVRRAGPHLDSLFHLRCEKRLDRDWCEKPARDYVILLGDYYHVTRESYPYKTLQAYLEPAVRVHRKTGKLLLPDGTVPENSPPSR